MSSLAELKASQLKAQIELSKAQCEKAEAETRAKLFEIEFAARSLADDKASVSDAHVYHFHGEVGALSCKNCIDELGKWARKDPGCEIEIIFNSPGGSVFEGFALFDFIKGLQKRGHRVVTKTIGKAASMGGILLQAGDVRVMSPHSFMLIHEVSSGAMGKASELEDMLKMVERLQEKGLAVLAERSTMNTSQIKRAWKRKDWWLDADEALKLGFVDEVGF